MSARPPARARLRRAGALGLVLLTACAEPGPPALPEIVASSKYIDYRADADTSVLCMDSTLRRGDAFVEDVAARLDVALPTGRINHLWDPTQSASDPEPWGCDDPNGAYNCYRYYDDENVGLITSKAFIQYHELVHAVEIPALGFGHDILMEGLADYLGTNNTSDAALAGFPTAFLTMLDSGQDPVDYTLSMHFVGSLIERHGPEKYKTLRTLLPRNAPPEQFQREFEAVYGTPLGVALDGMSTPIQGLHPLEGCGPEPIELLPWTDVGQINSTLTAQCGDPWFVGGGFAAEFPGFGASFAVDVTQPGPYMLTLSGSDDPYAGGSLASCDGPWMLTSPRGFTGTAELGPGRYVLSVLFPESPLPEGTVSMQLAEVTPP